MAENPSTGPMPLADDRQLLHGHPADLRINLMLGRGELWPVMRPHPVRSCHFA